MQAGIYTRISQDRTGDEMGVTRQRKACQALADREGWTVAEVYTDDDVSAYSGRARPAYARMLGDLEAGVIGAVIAWHPDRLHRDTRELEDFIDAVERAGATVRTVASGVLDLSTPGGRMNARLVGAVAKHESEQKGERVSAKMQELAEAGAYTGGGRLFGYTTSFEVIEAEAAAIREAAARLLDGASLNATAKMLNRSHVTTRGNEWTGTALRRMVCNPRLAGLKVYKGETIGAGDWPPILDRATHERLTSTLTGNPRRRRPKRTRLLGGLLVCGREGCGRKLVGNVTAKGTPIYICPSRQGWAGCGGISIVGGRTDDEVRDRTLAALAGPGLADALASAVGDDERQQRLTARLLEDEAALAQLSTDHYVDRVIGRAEFLTARDQLQDRIDEARRHLSGNGRARVLSDLPSDADDLADWWEAAELDGRRAVLTAMIETVTIAPAAYRGARWSPDRIHVDWRA